MSINFKQLGTPSDPQSFGSILIKSHKFLVAQEENILLENILKKKLINLI
ncbi:MAG: hypothetical protein ACTSQD_09990 [Promethearchaeota archaeon]